LTQVSQAQRIDFLGCPVDTLNIPQVLEWIRRASQEGKPRRIAVLNANKLHLMRCDPKLSEIVQAADLVVPEWAVVWGARRLGLGTLQFCAGIEISKALIPFAAKAGLRMFFLGASPEVVHALVERLTLTQPELVIAGYHHGYLRDKAALDRARSMISEAHPHVLLVAMGSPAQEYWIHDHAQPLGVPVSIGVGGTFDVLSGRKKDTPNWARGRGLEWLYRTVLSPRTHAKRYLITNPWFVWQVLRARLASSH
jgi:N-acetylglucosaminyldiphosphoundecaprenol N-acetyl-beta-D-mannosaminyltransferase